MPEEKLLALRQFWKELKVALELSHNDFRKYFPGMTFGLLLLFLSSSTVEEIACRRNARAGLNVLLSKPRRMGGLSSVIRLLLSGEFEADYGVWTGRVFDDDTSDLLDGSFSNRLSGDVGDLLHR